MAGLQGRVIGGYQLADQLGGGGIAEVYRARPTAPGGREVVVKVIYPEFVRQPGFRARFDQIVKNASRLSHPHILPLMASGEQNGYLYIITPYVAAGTLRDWLSAGRRLDSHDVAPFFRQLCEATGYAHSQSVLHGNIKPSNIFLYEGRHVLLGDFGRLWDINQLDMTHAGPGIEAVEYLAPEAIEGRGDPRSDIYSLGAVLFASLAGRAPYNGTTPFEVFTKHRQHPVPHLADVAPPLRASVVPLDDVVQRAMAKDPAARYPSALALAQSIEMTVRAAVTQASAGMGAPGMGGMPGGAALGPLGGPGGMPGLTSALPLGALGGMPAAMADAVAPGMVFAPRGGGPLGGGPLGGAMPAAHSPLGQMSFPPLPSAGLVDPTMEEGRPNGSGPFGGNAGALASPSLPPAALPAQPGAPGMAHPPMVPPAPGPGGPAAGGVYDIPVLPTQRIAAARPVGTPAANPAFDLTVQPTQRVPAPSESGSTSDPRPLAPAPAPGPAGMPLVPGFVVKGGAAQWPPATADLAAEAEARSPAGFGSDPSRGAGAPAFAPDMDEYGPPGGPSGALARDSRPYSATNLGLPRLTSPELGDLPASWRDIASRPMAVPGDHEADEDEPPDRWGANTGWTGETRNWGESEPQRGESGRWDESGEWGAESGEWGAANGQWSVESRAAMPPRREDDERWADSMADSRAYPAESGEWSSSMESVPDLFASSSLRSMDADNGRGKVSGKRRWSFGAQLSRRRKTSAAEPDDEPEGDPFADPSAWARPGDVGYRQGRTRHGRAVRAPRIARPRRMGPLLLILVLLVVVDGTMVVMLRPDLCPANRCAALHTLLNHYLPGVGGQAAAPPSPLTTAPAQVTLQVAAGGSANTTLTLTNTGKITAAWTASSALKWVSVGTTSGSLAPGGSAKVTLTAQPDATLAPGTYNTTVTFVVGATHLKVAVVVTVTPHH